MEIPTVRIKADNPLGYAIINESDFNFDEHDLFESEEMTGNPGQNDEESEFLEPSGEDTLTPVQDHLDEVRSEIDQALLVTAQKPEETPPEPKQRKRRHSVES